MKGQLINSFSKHLMSTYLQTTYLFVSFLHDWFWEDIPGSVINGVA